MKDPLYKKLKNNLVIQFSRIRFNTITAIITAGNSELRGMIVTLPKHEIPRNARGCTTYQFIIEYGSIKKPIGMTYGNSPNESHVIKRFKGCVSMFLYRQLKSRM